MPQPNDLSRSLVALDQNSTIIAVVELSQSSWLSRGRAHAARHAPSAPEPALPPLGAAPASRRGPRGLPTARPTLQPLSPPSAPHPVVGCALAIIISAKRRCARPKWSARSLRYFVQRRSALPWNPASVTVRSGSTQEGPASPAQCQHRQSRDLPDHTYERARITRSRPLLNHLWLGYSSDML
jgi:hypothetical protein